MGVLALIIRAALMGAVLALVAGLVYAVHAAAVTRPACDQWCQIRSAQIQDGLYKSLDFTTGNLTLRCILTRLPHVYTGGGPGRVTVTPGYSCQVIP